MIVGTLGKTLGSYGAYVCASPEIVDLLINVARAVHLLDRAAAAGRSGRPRRRFGCWTASRAWSSTCGATGRSSGRRSPIRGWTSAASRTQIVPVVVGDARLAMELCERALEGRVFAQAIRPPTVPDGHLAAAAVGDGQPSRGRARSGRARDRRRRARARDRRAGVERRRRAGVRGCRGRRRWSRRQRVAPGARGLRHRHRHRGRQDRRGGGDRALRSPRRGRAWRSSSPRSAASTRAGSPTTRCFAAPPDPPSRTTRSPPIASGRRSRLTWRPSSPGSRSIPQRLVAAARGAPPSGPTSSSARGSGAARPARRSATWCATSPASSACRS